MNSRANNATTILETPRLTLRAARPSDAEALYEGFKDPEVMRYWCSPPHIDISTTNKWLSSMINSSQNGITDFIITLKKQKSTTSDTDNDDDMSDEPVVIGKIGIYESLPSNEIGFLLSRAYWGKGLAKEALSHMLDYLFQLPYISNEAIGTTGSSVAGQQQQQDGKWEGNEDGNLNESNNEGITITTTSTPTTTTTTRYTPLTASYTTLTLSEQRFQASASASATSSPVHLHPCYPSLTADVDPRNAASLGLLRSVGFKESGYLKDSMLVGGESVDSVYLRLEREAYLLCMGK